MAGVAMGFDFGHRFRGGTRNQVPRTPLQKRYATLLQSVRLPPFLIALRGAVRVAVAVAACLLRDYLPGFDAGGTIVDTSAVDASTDAIANELRGRADAGDCLVASIPPCGRGVTVDIAGWRRGPNGTDRNVFAYSVIPHARPPALPG